ncbi:hypothetical protein D6C00_06100 [Thiohalobacter thiocyanaticus]|uniref:Uncharacterized protein n=1 Tax=Thiohalobacter thiocyanaticus TaxID=585455 RepID=A0A426QIG1_9GAMM|nr:hypothetical protein D6C00_06100 [Thiohalobacter thiocyanaticus]
MLQPRSVKPPLAGPAGVERAEPWPSILSSHQFELSGLQISSNGCWTSMAAAQAIELEITEVGCRTLLDSAYTLQQLTGVIQHRAGMISGTGPIPPR